MQGLRIRRNKDEVKDISQFLSALESFDDGNWDMVKVILTELPPQGVEAITQVGIMAPS